ncbi:MAG: hypothetical protein A2Z99_08870 [Treponema sp. GWB1_62_6]|nr:MAG: hypothetical protein A2Y36_14085 [Treponema sp. GWA1_62_8]OHE65940.1 MAG: hypothetical protein A2001_15935 [Treponema sp. GWC1_61_84]OHE69768.1 MAG: hypothetical protein A2Z99_08870 [Treponema sp. GWB1_62_6]OHE73664.1 MAG: hypothetical protein A2413_10505 [Treponema sp. RIFOXYC1_FULL_61_9]HCM28219.1 hypothetical protein [Treponema sp.]
MNPISTVVTKWAILAGSAVIATKSVPKIDQSIHETSVIVLPLSPSSSGDIIAMNFPDGRSYPFFSEKDDTVFALPIVAKVRLKLKKGFQPFEFFIGD